MSLNFVCGNESSPALNKVLCDYVSFRLTQRPHTFGPCGSLGIKRGDKTLGVVVFHNWIPEHGIMEITAAADNAAWLCKRSIREIMTICFVQHKCQQIVSRMAVNNERAIKIYDFLGFDTIILPNMRGKGKHEQLRLLTAEQWAKHKFNRVEDHGQKDT